MSCVCMYALGSLRVAPLPQARRTESGPLTGSSPDAVDRTGAGGFHALLRERGLIRLSAFIGHRASVSGRYIRESHCFLATHTPGLNLVRRHS